MILLSKHLNYMSIHIRMKYDLYCIVENNETET